MYRNGARNYRNRARNYRNGARKYRNGTRKYRNRARYYTDDASVLYTNDTESVNMQTHYEDTGNLEWNRS